MCKAYCRRGRVHINKNELESAFADWSEAIRLDPTLADPHAGLGAVYGRKGEFQKAIAECMKALQLDPTDQYAYAVRGAVYGVKGDYDLAIADLKGKPFGLTGRLQQTYANRAGIYTAERRLSGGHRNCAEAIRLNPKERRTSITLAAGFIEVVMRLMRRSPTITEAIRINPKPQQGHTGNRGPRPESEKATTTRPLVDFTNAHSAQTRSIAMAICIGPVFASRNKEQYEQGDRRPRRSHPAPRRTRRWPYEISVAHFALASGK